MAALGENVSLVISVLYEYMHPVLKVGIPQNIPYAFTPVFQRGVTFAQGFTTFAYPLYQAIHDILNSRSRMSPIRNVTNDPNC
jgi:hypothetical protein